MASRRSARLCLCCCRTPKIGIRSAPLLHSQGPLEGCIHSAVENISFKCQISDIFLAHTSLSSPMCLRRPRDSTRFFPPLPLTFRCHTNMIDISDYKGSPAVGNSAIYQTTYPFPCRAAQMGLLLLAASWPQLTQRVRNRLPGPETHQTTRQPVAPATTARVHLPQHPKKSPPQTSQFSLKSAGINHYSNQPGDGFQGEHAHTSLAAKRKPELKGPVEPGQTCRAAPGCVWIQPGGGARRCSA